MPSPSTSTLGPIRTSNRFALTCARIRMPVLWIALALMLVDLLVGDRLPAAVADVLPVITVAAFVVGMALYLRVGAVRGEPVPIASPVSGRWVTLNSPASRVPSHGLHAYGQTYAVDVVHEPTRWPRPGFTWWPAARRPEAFPAFGQPVHAPADGVVVRTHTRERDHWSRNSWLALPFLFVEGAVREALGPGRILGNHVVLDLGEGRYAVLAHLRRGSVQVRAGDRVTVGDQVAQCGNSGNSSEPHLHLQVMDHPRVLFAAGLPFRLTGWATDSGEPGSGLPASGEAFVASAP